MELFLRYAGHFVAEAFLLSRLTVHSTDRFNERQCLPKLGENKRFMLLAFDGELGSILAEL